MMKKAFHIIFIALLALNLTGAMALSYATDCGMECCRPTDWAATCCPSIEASTCCGMDGVTCGFEASQYQELFDKALCCSNKTGFSKNFSDVLLTTAALHAPTHSPTHALTSHSTVPPPSVPVYLSNAAFLC